MRRVHAGLDSKFISLACSKKKFFIQAQEFHLFSLYFLIQVVMFCLHFMTFGFGGKLKSKAFDVNKT
jgi:hypothetical protein